ncbi:MAG: saccharopine dehydrogenase NADP-binding domain-containing protein [Pseudomonadales bacterium]|nr:saccharopine dehydrogenase NADP-binding domain-containing protein [Pseudomonadales bacterium]
MSTDKREFDVIVWGATGFTGRLVVEYLAGAYGDQDLRWAIAGRNAAKLEAVRSETSLGASLPIIVADSDDAGSLDAMVQRARVICTTVGPYAQYGSALVAACARHGTHYCDLTGEVQWMRKMIDTYQAAAEESGAIIVHTCGFDCIPSDIGTWFVQSEMHRRHGVYASQVKFRVGKTRGGMSGGTVASMINMMEEADRDPSIRDLLQDPYALNPLNMPRGPDGPDQAGAVYDADFRQWTAPFVMSAINTRVVRRSNALMGYRYGKDFRYDESILVGDGPMAYVSANLVAGMTVVGALAAAFSPARGLIKRLAPAPGEGPDRDTIENGYYTIEFLGVHPEQRSKNLRARVTGDKDPGYGSTSKMLAESAVCLALDELPVSGGIWTPASAMGDALTKRLTDRAGLTFEVL